MTTLYTVEVTIATTLVVAADDEDGARTVAMRAWRRDIDDASPTVIADVRGAVSSPSDLRDGWTVECRPYGGAQSIKALLDTHREVE